MARRRNREWHTGPGASAVRPPSPRPRLIALVIWVSFLLIHTTVVAQEERGTGAVVVVPITGTIDLGLAPFLTRVLAEAEADGVAAVLLEIDTPGGRLDAVLQMRDAVLGSPVRTIAFVDRTAFSAGALIAIAAGEIYMPPGAAMGAATPVDGGTGETASEKTVSAVRTTFKATAEARGRDPLVAEAMVDPDVVIEGLVERGELLTLTTGEAVRWGYADGVVDNRAELLVDAGLAAAPVVEVGPSLAERVVRFVTDPVVASLLLILALLLIVGDFFVEGFGVAGMGGVLLFGIFFWGHLLTGLAGWEDVALVGLGIVLIAVEIFVVPGFGVPGVLGLAAIGGGLFLAMLGREIQTPDGIMRAGLTVVASLVAVVIGIGLMLALLPRTRKLSGLILQPAGEVTAPRREPAAWGWLRLFGDVAVQPRPG
nr:ATP-dependent Clp protease proteolytic subunit [Chloroflexia bacterium]